VNYKAGASHWILDSGCTQHMTGQVKMFSSLVDDVGDHEQVSFGDNSKGRISGLGEISLTNDLSFPMFFLWILVVITCFQLNNFVTLIFHAHLMTKGSQLLTKKN
jgi:hypothetical protein